MKEKSVLLLLLLIGISIVGIATVSVAKVPTSKVIDTGKGTPIVVPLANNTSGEGEIVVPLIDGSGGKRTAIVEPLNTSEGNRSEEKHLGMDTRNVTSPKSILQDADWIHGTDFNVQDPTELWGSVKLGWGTYYWGAPGTSNWFHVAIPTTVISSGQRNQLQRVMVLYQTSCGAQITNVHVWDGPNRIAAWDNLDLWGDHFAWMDGWNTFTFDNPPYIYWGIGISVQVYFGYGDPDTCIGAPRVLFTTAGADLIQ